MAYHYEQNASGQTELIIDGWEQGVGDSPFSGHQMISQMNIRNIPGVVYENLQQINSGSTITGRVNYFVQDQEKLSNIYAQCQNGKVYQSLNYGETWTDLSAPTGSQNGNGICIWNFSNSYSIVNYSYLVVFRDAAIDFIKINASGYTGSWTSITPFTTPQVSGQNHFCIQSRAKVFNAIPVLYFCNFGYLGSLYVAPKKVFDPADSSTYIFNDKQLALPKTDGGCATGLVELKDNLYITIGPLIVPWNYVDTEFSAPFKFTEMVSHPIVIGSSIYVFGGAYTGTTDNGNTDLVAWIPGTNSLTPVIKGRGYIYQYNGWDGGLFKKIPDHIINDSTIKEPQFFFGGCMNHLNKLYFGLGYTRSGDRFSGANGTWSLDENAFLVKEASSQRFPTALISLNNVLSGGNNTISFIEGRDEWNIGSSVFNHFMGYTAKSNERYSGSISTDIIKVGTNIKPKTFNQYEVRLFTPLGEGESISISLKKYYSETPSSATQYLAPAGDKNISFIKPCQVYNNEYIQFLISTSGLTGKSGCPIKEIILR